ncbi:MAG: MBL fold metallo-hydrolase [Rhodobacteraceae bacterium]|nr:MBL fold metallo-hydrolase [Paracoccaceae bacterium]
MRILPALGALFLSAVAASAAPQLQPQEVTPGVYALVGPTTQRDPENLGNNATFGLIVTTAGAVLIDAGATRRGAEQLDAAIRALTDQPVRYVINTGGQDHRWLGNAYWQDQGAVVIASADAVADQRARGSMQMTALSQLVGDGLAGTVPAYADVTFADAYELTLGGTVIEIAHPGPAHTPGDSFVWLPDTRTVFTGDIVYVGRILGVMDHSSSAGWVDSFQAMAALNPEHLVPGHGPVTDLATATRDTLDYLINLRARIAEHIAAGGDIIGAVEVDQSAFADLDNFDTLARRNAQEVFSQMEWE